ncbi:MAG: hypothetical protein ACYSP9_04245 [Planctomycetota bacterium]|jgi:hypothetical protein
MSDNAHKELRRTFDPELNEKADCLGRRMQLAINSRHIGEIESIAQEAAAAVLSGLEPLTQRTTFEELLCSSQVGRKIANRLGCVSLFELHDLQDLTYDEFVSADQISCHSLWRLLQAIIQFLPAGDRGV